MNSARRNTDQRQQALREASGHDRRALLYAQIASIALRTPTDMPALSGLAARFTVDDDQKLQTALDTLDPETEAGRCKLRGVIELRFGLNGEDPQSLGNIGEHFGVSHERVRQAEWNALHTLSQRVFPPDVV